MSSDLLFVYGTLRRGGSNDIARIQPRAAWHARATVRGVLYDLGAYPALLLADNAGWVEGELYAVPADAWAELDALEEPVSPQFPNGEYFKITARVQLPDGISRDAWIYVANPAVLDLSRPIESGDWMAHAAQHGK